MITPLDILSIESWALIGTIAFLAWYYVHRKWQYLKKLNIPHDPPTLLNFGHARKMIGEDLFYYDLKMKDKHGPIWGAYFGLTPFIVVHDPDILRPMFIKEFSNFPTRSGEQFKISGKELNTGLNLLEGKEWKRVRSSMTPTFSTAKLKQMNELIDWCTNNTIEVLKRKCKTGDGIIDNQEVFSKLSLDILCSAAFSTKVHSQDDTKEEPEISKHAKRLLENTWLTPLLYLLFTFPFTAKIIEKLNLSVIPSVPLKYFKDFTEFVIDQREANPHQRGRVDFLQLLLDSKISEEEAKANPERGMTRTEIVGNSMLMIFAGYDNVARTISYLAYNLAQYPEIQKELQTEIAEMIKTRGKFDYEGVTSLKLLDMCVNESLRLYNPILRNQRFGIKDITIKGFTLPSKTSIAVPTFALSHDPEHWDDPWEFKPERMRDMSAIDPMIFQPFGAGPRNCIGLRFAVLELKMAIAKLVHHFTLKPTATTPKPPLKLIFDSVVRTETPISLQLIPREQDQEPN